MNRLILATGIVGVIAAGVLYLTSKQSDNRKIVVEIIVAGEGEDMADEQPFPENPGEPLEKAG